MNTSKDESFQVPFSCATNPSRFRRLTYLVNRRYGTVKPAPEDFCVANRDLVLHESWYSTSLECIGTIDAVKPSYTHQSQASHSSAEQNVNSLKNQQPFQPAKRKKQPHRQRKRAAQNKDDTGCDRYLQDDRQSEDEHLPTEYVFRSCLSLKVKFCRGVDVYVRKNKRAHEGEFRIEPLFLGIVRD